MRFITDKTVKRLAIYFFYDSNGIADEYNFYLLNNLKEHVNELFVVCNGILSPESRKRFSDVSDHLLVRENKGLDVWAYKEAMAFYGWKKLSEFDEVILLNFTIFGPLYPFKEMFDTMDAKDLDFWGITVWHTIPFDPFGTVKYGYIPKHIQSHFMAYRKTLVSSYEFQQYWDNIPEINTYAESIGFHEAIFTKDFEDKGYKWDAYVNTDELEKHTAGPINYYVKYLIEKKRCPIIKRRSFFHHMDDVLNNTCGQETVEAFKYIENNLDYDVNLIWDNLLRTQHQSDIKNRMHLNYIIPTSFLKYSNSSQKKMKVALIVHIYYKDLINYCFNYAKSMPSYADIYVTTQSEDMRQEILSIFSQIECNKLEVVLVDNRGRDVSALLIGCKEFIMDYDLVCFAHDKKTKHLEPLSVGESFSYTCFENVLYNEPFVENIINTFLDNPRLGLLTPPPPNHAQFFTTMGFVWSINFEACKDLAKKLKIDVPMSLEKDPIAPIGSMFWFRPAALKQLFDYNWKYDDFPEEPHSLVDGTISNAIERIHPFVAQHNGYYPAWVFSQNFSSIQFTNLYYMFSEINKATMAKLGLGPYFATKMRIMNDNNLDNYNPELQITFKKWFYTFLKRVLPKPVSNRLIAIKNKYKSRA